MEGHPPRGRPPSTPRHAAPHRAFRPRGQCWAPTPAHRRPQHVGSGPRQPVQGMGSRGRGSACPQTPLTTAKGSPHGNAPLPAPQRATTARKGACCRAGAGSPRPHHPHPGHMGRGTPAARPKGRAAVGGTAPDTTPPSQLGRPPPPGDGPPPPPRHAALLRACTPRGQCRAPTPAHPHLQHVGSGPQRPAQRTGSRGRESA